MSVNVSDNWTDMFVRTLQQFQEDVLDQHPAEGLSRDAVEKLRMFEEWLKEQMS